MSSAKFPNNLRASAALPSLPSSSAAVSSADFSKLNDSLRDKTFAVQGAHEASMADAELYAELYPILVSDKSTLPQFPNILRYFSLIQAHPAIRPAAQEAGMTSLDFSAERKLYVPPERKAEVKVKKTAAPTESAAAAPAVVAKEKKQKKEKAAPSPVSAAATSSAPTPGMIDLRVGRIISVEKHPEADSLYVEQIDVGESEPRTVVSGLVNYIPIEEMRGKWLVTVCNLKPASMRGIKSFAMVLAATAKDGKTGMGSVELMAPPEGSVPGDRVFFEGFESATPEAQLNPKKKIFETVQPGFTTLEDKQGAWVNPTDGAIHRIVTSRGPVKAPTHVGASLS